MHPHHRAVALAVFVACCSASAAALASRQHRADERAYGAEGSYRVGGYGDRIYPPAYDGVRAYYGGRHDNRWRWGDTPWRGNDSPMLPFVGVPLPYSGYGARW